MTKTWKRNTATCLPVPSPNVWHLLRMLMFMFVSRERTAGPVCTNYLNVFGLWVPVWTYKRSEYITDTVNNDFVVVQFHWYTVPIWNFDISSDPHGALSLSNVSEIIKFSPFRDQKAIQPRFHPLRSLAETDGSNRWTDGSHFSRSFQLSYSFTKAKYSPSYKINAWPVFSPSCLARSARVWSRFALAANTPVMARRLHDTTILVVVQGREQMLNSAKILPPSHPPLLPPLAKTGRA